MSDLVDFLKARLAKDEQIARACSGTSWTVSAPGTVSADDARAEDGRAFVASVENEAYAEHIARQDPARVLRQVAAVRLVVEEHEKQAWVMEHGSRRETAQAAHAARETVLRLLASAYADHPAYREEWRP
ncbi:MULTISPECIES: DUF6221 family protein [Actinomadura]|uniref:DUF6221 family protein n=1 Tax=Actinomadura yumaensis TaxID=111807 RepID=A0ABW2D0U5_9ACTN|nr:DUF6221 family protein [Actinomadura sp. J1-007]MWK32647.1 hypothetical protein [Actinomadura sp. J1-007]